VTITAQALDLTDDPQVSPQAMQDPGLPVPGDPTAIAMFTAHRLDDTMHELAHATERMTAARAAATGELRAYHSGHIFRHLQGALDACHDLTANLREHYPAEAAELEQVKQAIGLAKSLTPEVKAATTAHLLETTLHEETHGVRHAEAMLDPDPEDVWEFNADHCEKHLGGAVEHAAKLRAQFADNYPDVAKWLAELDEIAAGPEEGGTSPQHARYAKGTVSAQMANPVTIGGQVDLAAWEHEARGKDGEWTRAYPGSPGEDWRRQRSPEDEALLRKWEKDPRAVSVGPERTRLRSLLKTAPTVDGPVYRGDETKGGPYGIMPLDQQEQKYRAMIGTDQVVKFPRNSSASTKPEIAGGFGHTLYQIDGAGAKGIGNSLHEAVMPPGKFKVTGVEQRTATVRSAFDGKTMHPSNQVVVHLAPADGGSVAHEVSLAHPVARAAIDLAKARLS
jgi:hypothetical protein